MTSSAPQNEGARRVVTQVSSLESLVGAHPDALRSIYVGGGTPADPAELGETTDGRLLAVAPGEGIFFALRPLVRAAASNLFPWKGKTFDHGGNSGTNIVFGGQRFRFRAERSESWVDAAPTLRLIYGDAAFDNPWPVRNMIDELRTVGDGIAIGPAWYASDGEHSLVLWFGLSAQR